MTMVDRIKGICKEKKIPISRLERDCEFSNGYLASLSKGNLPLDRLMKVAIYLDSSPDYLAFGKSEEKKTQRDNLNKLLEKAEKTLTAGALEYLYNYLEGYTVAYLEGALGGRRDALDRIKESIKGDQVLLDKIEELERLYAES